MEIDRVLEGRARPVAPASTGPLLCGMSAAARFLGVSRSTLWRMVKAGRLGRVEVMPNSFRIRRAELEAIAAGPSPDH